MHGLKGERVLMRIHIGERDKFHGTPLHEAIVRLLRERQYAGATVTRAISGFGATAKLLWPGRLVRTSYVLYLAQGWAIVAAFGPFASAVSVRVLVLLVAGGVIYTLGVIFHLWERLPYHNAIWHGFVIAASACHFAAIVDAVVFAASA